MDLIWGNGERGLGSDLWVWELVNAGEIVGRACNGAPSASVSCELHKTVIAWRWADSSAWDCYAGAILFGSLLNGGGVVMSSQSRRFASTLAQQGVEQNLKHGRSEKGISDDPKRKLVPWRLLLCNRLIRMIPTFTRSGRLFLEIWRPPQKSRWKGWIQKRNKGRTW